MWVAAPTAPSVPHHTRELHVAAAAHELRIGGERGPSIDLVVDHGVPAGVGQNEGRGSADAGDIIGHALVHGALADPGDGVRGRRPPPPIYIQPTPPWAQAGAYPPSPYPPSPMPHVQSCPPSRQPPPPPGSAGLIVTSQPNAQICRASSSFTRWDVGVGAGLGLSTCQQIAVHHQGRIEVESTPGAGSTFTLCIPVR